MIKAVIIEDELAASRKLQRLLHKQGVEVMAQLSSIADALQWFGKHESPEVLFLDMKLSDGLGFYLLDQLPQLRTKIVCTTAYPEYSIQAFDYNSVAYLLKPINEDKLVKALEKIESLQAVSFQELRNTLGTARRIQGAYKRRFTTKIGASIRIFEATAVCCFFSADNATYLNASGRNALLNTSLTHLSNQLDPHDFFRVNRKVIIARHALISVDKYSVTRLLIKLRDFSEFEIIVSRDRVKAFKNWLDLEEFA